jgi:hypothetical protein
MAAAARPLRGTGAVGPSTHDWLEGRGGRMYLIAMIDDATSRLWARFVGEDGSEENRRLLQSYLEKYGRPLAFYTDKAGIFQVAVKSKRQEQREGLDRQRMPPTQIERALRELGIVWIAAHSPQAKGRAERQFQTAQDRLVKGMRVAGVHTLEQANAYLEKEYLPWWNQTLVAPPAHPENAHRALGREHNLAAILSHVEQRQVTNDYTIRWDGKFYQIDRRDVWPGMRRAMVRVEQRLDGTLAVRFGWVRASEPVRAAVRRSAATGGRGEPRAAPGAQTQTQVRVDEEFLRTIGSLRISSGDHFMPVANVFRRTQKQGAPLKTGHFYLP